MFISENNTLYNFQSGFGPNFQSGFGPNHSKKSVFITFSSKILKGFDEGLLTGFILIELQKAFDTIDDEILLQKRQAVKLLQQNIQWFMSSLLSL